MLESQLRVDIHQPGSHHEVLGHPLSVLRLEGLQLRTHHAVQFASGDVLVNIRRLRTVGAVGTAKVLRIVRALRHDAFFLTGSAELTAVAVFAAGTLFEVTTRATGSVAPVFTSTFGTVRTRAVALPTAVIAAVWAAAVVPAVRTGAVAVVAAGTLLGVTPVLAGTVTLPATIRTGPVLSGTIATRIAA